MNDDELLRLIEPHLNAAVRLHRMEKRTTEEGSEEVHRACNAIPNLPVCSLEGVLKGRTIASVANMTCHPPIAPNCFKVVRFEDGAAWTYYRIGSYRLDYFYNPNAGPDMKLSCSSNLFG
jgi:hypothetical protein